MERVSISKLKDQLSAYIKKAKAGHPILIMDRGRPVAKLERADAELGADAGYQRLVAAGLVRPAKRKFSEELLRPVDLGREVGVLETLLEDRETGR